MRILLVGSGGREHALARALARSPRRPKLLIAPGNPGTARHGRNIPVQADDLDGLQRLAQDERVDLTVVGPEAPLVAGIVDRFESAGLKVFGPSQKAAQLEGSKAFAKAFMQEHDIPTARHRTFGRDELDEALAFAEELGAPVVVKASGLAAGKGAVVCQTLDEARRTLRDMLEGDAFGAAADEVVVESFMEGEEASLFVLTDGERFVLLPPAQDHKPVGEGDTGPNTGGMGAYAPAPVVTSRVLSQAVAGVVMPTLAGMAAKGMPYRGVLYVGLMITDEGPKVVEYNCRFGDPETQAVLALVESDLATLFERVAEGALPEGAQLHVDDAAAACVVMASEGYPGAYEKGRALTGVDEADALEHVAVFHAGTREQDGKLVTNGGRVLGVTGTAPTLREALDRAYEGVHQIRFDGAHFRRDIGQRGLERLGG